MPPVLPREIAQNYGIEVVFAAFPTHISEVMGFYDFDGRKIFVNADDHVNRQTFTIAHELGHALLHIDFREQYQVLLRRPMGAEADPLEKEANHFAAKLLVPKRFLDQYYKIASVSELARLFVVSEEVIRYRLKNEYNL